MTKWLASVQSIEEAKTLIPSLPDILDIKNPLEGALGALDITTVASIVGLVSKQCQTSATIGDLPMKAELINLAVRSNGSIGSGLCESRYFP